MKIPTQFIGKVAAGLLLTFVLVALTGALGDENLKQRSSAEKDEIEFLRLMLEDLKNDKEFLQNLSQDDSSRFEEINSLRVKMHDKSEITAEELSMTFMTNFSDFNSSKFTINALTFSRSLGVIKDKALLRDILKYYQLCDDSERVEQDFFSFDRELTLYFINSNSSEMVSKELLNDKKFKKYVQYYNLVLGEKAKASRKLLNDSNQLIVRIEDYLDT